MRSHIRGQRRLENEVREELDEEEDDVGSVRNEAAGKAYLVSSGEKLSPMKKQMLASAERTLASGADGPENSAARHLKNSQGRAGTHASDSCSTGPNSKTVY